MKIKHLQELAQQGKIDENSSLTDRQSIIINRPIGEVYRLIAAITNWPEWNKEVKWVKGGINKGGDSFNWSLNGKKHYS